MQGMMQRYNLREEANADPQTYALGLKEVWEVRVTPNLGESAQIVQTPDITCSMPETTADYVMMLA